LAQLLTYASNPELSASEKLSKAEKFTRSQLVPFLAIGAFAGLRSAEASVS